MRYAYYGHYAAYYEVSRTDLMRKLGVSYRQLEDMGIIMPVVEMHLRYYKPAKYDDLITVKVTVKEMPTARIMFYYEITNEDGVKLNEGYTLMTFADRETGRPVRPPKILTDAMKPFFED
jgi:acyl-CoA thioester hydrolase